jgi:hypothetical protein
LRTLRHHVNIKRAMGSRMTLSASSHHFADQIQWIDEDSNERARQSR